VINLLLIANGYLKEIPRFLPDSLGIGDIHLISDGKPAYELRSYHHFRDCTYGNFHDLDKYSELPLDRYILDSMSVCESNVLKMMERYQFSKGLLFYEERINLYHRQLRYWYNYLAINRIEVCLFSVIPHVVFDYILYCLCKKLGIKTVLFYRTTILLDSNVSIYPMLDIDEQMIGIKGRYEYHLMNPEKFELSDRASSYLSLRQGNDGKTFTGVAVKKRDIRKYFSPEKYIKHIAYKVDYIFEWIKLWGRPVDLLCRMAYKMNLGNMTYPAFQKNPDLECAFIYVSLHYQPECSTSPMGGCFVHQDLMLDILMNTIPKNIKIYIKAHLRGGMSHTLFRRLQTDARTVLLDPSMNSFKLINKSIAVATITGTAGWEAFINKKPVLMFGSYFYQDAPGVFKVETMGECREAVSTIISGRCLIEEEHVTAFLKAIDDLSYPGWVDNRYAPMSQLTEEQNCNNIASRISAILMASQAQLT